MIKLNSIDKNIIKQLQLNGRITYAELARKVGLTTSPCIDRVRKLERDGFIRGYTAQVAPELLDAGLVVFVQIRLEQTSSDGFQKFQDAVSRMPEVQECHLVSGGFDYLIKARVADIAAYRTLLGDSLLSLPGVAQSNSIVTMDTAKETLAINLS